MVEPVNNLQQVSKNIGIGARTYSTGSLLSRENTDPPDDVTQDALMAFLDAESGRDAKLSLQKLIGMPTVTSAFNDSLKM